MKHRSILILITGLLYFTLAGPVNGVMIERVAGVVNDIVIPYTQVQLEKAIGLYNGDDRMILQAIIDRKLLLQEAEKFKITEEEGDRERVEKYMQKIRQSIGEGQLKEILATYGFSEKDLKEILHEKIIAERLIEFRIKFFIIISDSDIKKYYQAHKKEFKNKPLEAVKERIRQILSDEETKIKLDDYLFTLRSKARIIMNL